MTVLVGICPSHCCFVHTACYMFWTVSKYSSTQGSESNARGRMELCIVYLVKTTLYNLVQELKINGLDAV